MPTSNRLVELETLITTNQPDFYVVGTSLSEIQAHLLFKTKSSSFEEYVENQWDMKRAHAYRMMAAARVIKNLSPIGYKLPQNEAQARPLTRLSSSTLKTIWTLFIQSQQPQTARNIRRFILQQSKKNKAPDKPEIERMSEAYQQAVDQLLQQIEINQKQHWKTTSIKAALRWNKVCLKKIKESLNDGGH